MAGKFKYLIWMFVITGLLYSCKDDSQQADDNNIDTTEVDVDVVENNMYYKFPSPVELYIFLWEEDAVYNAKLLNSTDNSAKYVTTDRKAINFGIYASDLAYCTVFGKNQETFNYFTTVKVLADELGLMEGFDEVMAKRIDENISNPDSLYKLSSDSYSDAITYLESIKQGNLLPFIVAGGWIESVYIAVNSVKTFSEKSGVVMRVVEQQMVLEDMVEYLSTMQDDEQMKMLYDKLSDIKDSFDKLYDNTDEIITKDQFDEIALKINKLRNEFVN
ncbi:MAG: hypothetical protein ABIJ97_11360 [Bacteroidota bacterium]